MESRFSKTRAIALFCAFVMVFSLVLTGCGSVKRINKKGTGENGDDVINVGEGSGMEEQGSQIVVGDDGNSYIVDGEGNSIVYDAPAGTLTTVPVKSTVTSNTATTTKKPENNKPNNDKTTTKKVTTTKYSDSPVYNAFAVQRKFGFNKGYDNLTGLVNFYLDTIRAYFTYDDKDWLVEVWKGEYAWGSVGCEIGFYYRDHDQKALDYWGADKLHYTCVEDNDAMEASMELWQYVKPTDKEPKHILKFSKKLCWWAAAFDNGYLETHSDRTTLVMRGTIEFPTHKMMNLFTDQLEKKGFKEGSTSSYKLTERYSVKGTEVTFVWRYFDEDKGMQG